MEPWQTLVLVGAAIACYGWLVPQAKQGAADARKPNGEEAYDQLLEDLEAENRQLLDAVASFKREQDDTVRRLGQRIRELETQMGEWREREARHSPAGRAEAPVPAAAAVAAPRDAAGAPGVARPIAEAMAESAAGAERATAPPEPQSMRARYAELLELYARGRSVEQIAKALNLNKGEVQLILQLAKREERYHA